MVQQYEQYETEPNFRPKNREELEIITKACLAPVSEADLDFAIRSPYSPFLKKLLNLELDQVANLVIFEKLWEYREFLANEAKLKEREEILKDEIAREASAERRLFVTPKPDYIKSMQAVVEERELEELKALQAALPARIEELEQQSAAIAETIAEHVARRDATKEDIQTQDEELVSELVAYSEAIEWTSQSTGQRIQIPQGSCEKLGHTLSKQSTLDYDNIPIVNAALDGLPEIRAAKIKVDLADFRRQLAFVLHHSALDGENSSVIGFIRAGQNSIMLNNAFNNTNRENRINSLITYKNEGQAISHYQNEQKKINEQREKAQSLSVVVNEKINSFNKSNTNK